MREAWDSVLVGFEQWRARIVFVLAALAFGLSFSDSGHVAAMIVAFALPVFAALSALVARRGEARGAGAGLLVALATCVATEQLAAHTFFEPTPWSTITLSADHPAGEVMVPAAEFEVETRGQVPEGSSSAEGVYRYELTRNQTTVTASGELSRTAPQVVRRRRMPGAVAGHVYDTERQLVALPGSGSIQIKLDSIEGSIGKSVEVRLLPPPLGGHWATLILYPLLILALVLDALASTRKFPGFAGWLAIAMAFTLRATQHYTPHDPMAAVVSSLFIALVISVGAYFVAWVLSRFTGSLVRKPAQG